jgi:hypothetical protein
MSSQQVTSADYFDTTPCTCDGAQLYGSPSLHAHVSPPHNIPPLIPSDDDYTIKHSHDRKHLPITVDNPCETRNHEEVINIANYQYSP